MVLKRAPNWAPFIRYDHGDINRFYNFVLKDRYIDGEGGLSVLKKWFRDKYSYDIMPGTGPYIAIVLKVLSAPKRGPGARSASAKQTKTINNIVPTVEARVRKDCGEHPEVRVIARIPEIDADIKFPENSKDEMRIGCHAEFTALSSTPATMMGEIEEGSLIYVQYSSEGNKTGFNGLPAGKIIGVHSTPRFMLTCERESTEVSFNPPCQAARTLANPGGGLYVGHTKSDIKYIGPPIAKIKGKIKTGIYGNGTAQTKAHFDEAMKESTVSSKRGIQGAAPVSKNAFIWIGTLKNNGYLDLLDRPITAGRETIIYAPMTLDIDSPIEIKYYFHDAGGFGHAWINGPNTTLEQATNVPTSGNDFKEKIGPGIKDLIREGRNFILVIPEMAHSRGFGTGRSNKSRIQGLIEGKPAGVGEGSDTNVVRYNFSSDMRPHIKEYLRSMPIEKNKNLLHITHLIERPYCTFDGSYSGGNFELFHQEVIEVLNEHLGKIDDKIEFVSILADGVGAISLASIVKTIPNSEVHFRAERGFKNVNINRIDFVAGEDLDTAANDSYFPVTPSYSIYTDYLLGLAAYGRKFEFNYIIEKTEKPWFNTFFDKLGLSSKFKEANKSSGHGFSHNIVGTDVSINMHVAQKDEGHKKHKVGYAFNWRPDVPSRMKKGDEKIYQRPSFDAVPDHAAAIASKPAASDLARYQKKLEDLTEPINFFEILIQKMSSNGINSICAQEGSSEFPEYQIYCSFVPTAAVIHSKSQFFADYLDYLENKKNYMKTLLLQEAEVWLLNSYNNRAHMQAAYDLYNVDLAILKKGGDDYASQLEMQKKWDELRTSFKIDNFSTIKLGEYPFSFGAPADGGIARIAKEIAKFEALTTIVAKIRNALDRLPSGPQRRSPECAPSPINLADLIRPKSSPAAAAGPSIFSCNDQKIAIPSNFDELTQMIPYYPSSSDFNFGPKRTSFTKSNIEDHIKVKKFKYKARGVEGAITYHQSPPIWACISEKIRSDWESACIMSGYIPFKIISGIRGAFKQHGVTAYKHGISLHTFGLGFKLDPYIAGTSNDGKPIYSVYTGAWTAGFIDQHGQELYDLGVFKYGPGSFFENAYESRNRLRMTENWDGANDCYQCGFTDVKKNSFNKIMVAAKGTPIVPRGANPTQWLISFCEKSDMKWGNSTFLKKRWRGGNTWTPEEQNRIAAIYGIPDIVPRIYSISWRDDRFDNHSHFQYYNNSSSPGGLILWTEIEKAANKIIFG